VKDERSLSEEDRELLAAFEAEEASSDERLRAEALLEASAEARAVFERLRSLRAATGQWQPLGLSDVARARVGKRLEAALAFRPPTRRGSRRLLGVAMAVVGAAAAALLLLGPRLRAPTTVDGAMEPSQLATGVHFRTGPREHQLLPLGERGVAFVGEQSDLEIGPAPVDVTVHGGSARFVIRRAPSRSFVIATSAAEVEVRGTEFDVVVVGTATDVRVVRGEVEVRNAFGRRRLWAREAAHAEVGSSPLMVEHLDSVILDGPAELITPDVPAKHPRQRR